MQTLSILMIDDNEDDRESFCRVLSKQSDITFEITQSDDGAEGIELATNGNFDCILLDYSMPGYDGLRIIKELRLEKFEQPILMLTGEGNERIAVSAMKDGAQDYIVKKEALKNGELSAAILSAIEHRQEELQIIESAAHDSLTGLKLRAPFLEHLDQTLKNARRNETTLAVLYIDLDGFKPINDTLGHRAGDYILAEMSRRFTQCVREVDCVGRYGGDEFVITLANLNGDGLDDCAHVCHRIVDSITNHPFIYNGQHVTTSLSIGVAIAIAGDMDQATLLERADRAMYKAKKSVDHHAYYYESHFQFARKQPRDKQRLH